MRNVIARTVALLNEQHSLTGAQSISMLLGKPTGWNAVDVQKYQVVTQSLFGCSVASLKPRSRLKKRCMVFAAGAA